MTTSTSDPLGDYLAKKNPAKGYTVITDASQVTPEMVSIFNVKSGVSTKFNTEATRNSARDAGLYSGDVVIDPNGKLLRKPTGMPLKDAVSNNAFMPEGLFGLGYGSIDENEEARAGIDYSQFTSAGGYYGQRNPDDPMKWAQMLQTNEERAANQTAWGADVNSWNRQYANYSPTVDTGSTGNSGGTSNSSFETSPLEFPKSEGMLSLSRGDRGGRNTGRRR